jgi:hypothetical protein
MTHPSADFGTRLCLPLWQPHHPPPEAAQSIARKTMALLPVRYRGGRQGSSKTESREKGWLLFGRQVYRISKQLGRGGFLLWVRLSFSNSGSMLAKTWQQVTPPTVIPHPEEFVLLQRQNISIVSYPRENVLVYVFRKCVPTVHVFLWRRSWTLNSWIIIHWLRNSRVVNIFSLKRKDLTELKNEKFYNLCCTPDITRIRNSRKMGLPGHIARIEYVTNAYKILDRKNWRKRLSLILQCRWEANRKTDASNRLGDCGLDSSGSGQVPVVGCTEYSNKRLGTIRDGGFSSMSVVDTWFICYID